MTTPIIAFCNHKGGAGKTTSAYYIGQHLAHLGIRVLSIDLDSQGTLSKRIAETGWNATIADYLDATIARQPLPALEYAHHNPCLIPADRRLAWMAARMQTASPNHNILQRTLRLLASDFDAVIIDCSPAADITIVNALVAATHIVICATPTPESWDGQERMKTMLAELRDSLGAAPDLLGIIATQVISRTTLHQSHLLKMGAALLGVIPQRTGQDQSSQLSDAYMTIADDIAEYLTLTEALHA